MRDLIRVLTFVGVVATLFLLLLSPGSAPRVTTPMPTQAKPAEVQEKWDELVELIDHTRNIQGFADAATDPIARERLRELADDLRVQAERVAGWLDSHGAILPEDVEHVICAWCEASDYGICRQCSDVRYTAGG